MLLALILTLFAHAAPESVTLDMKFAVAEKNVSNPRMILNLGTMGAMTEKVGGDTYTIELLPKKSGELVEVSMKIIKNGKVFYNTKTTGEVGGPMVSKRSLSGQPSVELTVVPTLN